MEDAKACRAYRALLLIRQTGEASTLEIADHLGGSRTNLHRTLEYLKREGLIYSYMRGIYRVTDKGKPPERQ